MKRRALLAVLALTLLAGFAIHQVNTAPKAHALNCLGAQWYDVTSGDFTGMVWTGHPHEIFIELQGFYIPVMVPRGQQPRVSYCGEARAIVHVTAQSASDYTLGTQISICDTTVDSSCVTSLSGTTTSNATITAGNTAEIDGSAVTGFNAQQGTSCPDTGVDQLVGYWQTYSGSEVQSTMMPGNCIPQLIFL